MLRHDRRGTLRFAPLQGRFGAAVITRHPELTDVDSMLWVEAPGTAAERVGVRSAAALRVAAYLGGFWTVASAARVLPRAWCDAAYALIARHRHNLFGSAEPCVVPEPGQRARFLD